jgi:hypothetical protein
MRLIKIAGPGRAHARRRRMRTLSVDKSGHAARREAYNVFVGNSLKDLLMSVGLIFAAILIFVAL